MNSISRSTVKYPIEVFSWLAGAVITISLASIIWKWESRDIISHFNNSVLQHHEIFQTRMTFAFASAKSVVAFFASSQEVTRAEFSNFTKRLQTGDPYFGIQAVEWIPRVKATDRAAYEAAAREDGYKEFVFTERTNQGNMVPAGDRDEYYPVYYIEPYQSNEIAFGFDLASNPTRLKALEQARDTNQQTASERITLVQEQGDSFGFLLFSPVYNKDSKVDSIESRRKNLKGLILIVYRIQDFIEQGEFMTGDMNMLIFDVSAPEEKQLLYPSKSPLKSFTENSMTNCVTTTESVGGRAWKISHCPKGSASLFTDHKLSFLVILLGFAATLLVASRFSLISKQRRVAASAAADLAYLIDTANAPIFGIDLTGGINEWNRKTENITGFSRHVAIGKDLVANHITDDKKDEVRRILMQTLGGIETSNYELTLSTRSGTGVDILLNWTTRRDAQGEITGAIGIGQDLTEIKTYQAQIIQASKLALLGEMSTSVAHELNQPLHTILMAASNINDRIESGNITPAYLQKKLQRIKGQVERASLIINHMRMFGRIDDQKSVIFDPEKAVEGAISLVGEQLRLVNIELSSDFVINDPKVIGSQIQLEQVFINIILNARDAILQENNKVARKITIHGAPLGINKIKISITDTGGGIDEKIFSRIFDPFFTTKIIAHGTGLGLSISYGIIRDMQGSLTAENTDEGTRFTVIIPLAA